MKKPFTFSSFRSLLIIVLLTITGAANAQILTEGFESGLPTGGSSTVQDFTLSSGVWTILKGASSGTRNSGSLGLKLSAGSTSAPTYAAAPAVNAVTTLKFWAKGSSTTTVTIQKSVNGGAYTTVVAQAITSTFAQYTITVNDASNNIRIRFTNFTSQTHYIDDVTITGGVASPALSVTPASLAFGNQTVNTASAIKTFSVSGSALSPASGNITVTAPAGFLISATSGSGYASTVNLAYTGGVLTATTLYAVFNPSLVQAYSGNITVAGGGAATQNIAVTGTGTAVPPSLSVTPSSLAFGSVLINTTSAEKSYAVSGANLSPASGNITITAPAGYLVSTTSGSGYASSITIPYSGAVLSSTTVYAIFTPTAAQSYNGNITNAGGGATTVSVAVSGTGLQPTLSVAPTSLAFGNVLTNTTSTEKTYALSGSNLSPASGSVTITAPAGYQVSLTTGAGFASSAAVAYSGSTLASTTVYVRFNPTAVQSYSGNITNAGGGAATVNVAVSGAGIVPSLSVSPASLAFGSVSINTTSTEKTYTVTGANLSPASGSVAITAPAGYEVSLTTGSGFASSVSVNYSGSALSATIYVRFKPTAVQSYSGNITNTGGGATAVNVALTGSGIQQTTSSTAKYVSPTGSDSNPGTFAAPFLTITKAVSVSVAGDTIYMRGGTYALSSTISISKNGTATARFNLLAYPGEKPVLDFSAMSVSSSNRGVNLSGSYWYIRGIDFFHAGDNGMFMSGSNNIIELCNFYENSDTGLQIGGGASNNKVINCDSYYNADPANGNADGFAAKLDVGTGNYFFGCRAWQNSDDGWDGYLRPSNDVSTTLENCVCYKNGYLKSGSASAGNGNGFKMGGSDLKDLMHNFTLKNCLAVANRVKGFDQNNNRGNMTLYNCTGYNNGTNYSIPLALNAGKTAVVTNCISAGTGGVSLGSFVIQTTDSWQSGFTVTNADFVSTDVTQVIGARNADGSLPTYTFMHLAAGSDLIDRGTNVGLPFAGTAPDLGCFESGTSARPAPAAGNLVTGRSVKVIPNIISSNADIRFSIEESGPVAVTLVNSMGQTVAILYNANTLAGKNYTVSFTTGKLPSGTYYAVMQDAKQKNVVPLVICK